MPTYTGSESNDTIVGSDETDTIYGLGGDDRLFGGARYDLLYGGAGNDYLEGGGYSNDVGNYLYGEDGDDILTGGGSNMYGGTGNDIYYVSAVGYYQVFGPSDAGDRVFEVDGEGFDTVYSRIDFTLAYAQSIELLAAHPANPDLPINLTGNNYDNTIRGNTAVNTLSGGGGTDLLYGLGGNDLLFGAEGDDFLIGGVGADRMEGGAGSDTYYVDEVGDLVVEPAAEGSDRVAASVSYSLASDADVEILEAVNLGATNTLDLTGNQFGQTIHGNSGANILRGYGGNDVLWGFAGTDYLVGGTGADVMWGGTGDDTYYVDHVDDRIYELAGEGYDRVAAEISVTLPDTADIELIEAVNLSATTAMNLGGSDTANTIRGNAGVNILYGYGGNDALYGYGGEDYLVGGTGADAMYGGTGNDTFYVDNSSDFVSEAVGEGTDRIATTISLELSGVSEVEVLEVVNSGGTEAFVLTGSDFANTIIGNAGANVINGRGGSDVLVGLGGADTFQFTTALGSGNIDRIEDFQVGSDKIALENAVFTFANPGSLDTAYFHAGSAAHDADDRVIYNSSTGALYYDADGNGSGAAVQFATLAAGLALSAGDFVVI